MRTRSGVLILTTGAVAYPVADQVRGHAEAGHAAEELGVVVADGSWNWKGLGGSFERFGGTKASY